ncbi:MAG: methyltransferase [Bacteroidales bacterium]|nr:methyltransferase [Bacteroidales bacterium]
MSNYHFDFQKFSIIQEHSAMKVGTDGVLLGAWANLPNLPFSDSLRPQILDIGTGTGVIALMLAQRFSEALIDAIEIDHEAAKEAKLNAKNSPWKDRINVFETSLEDYIPETKSYDLIVTNPPFYNATLKPEDEARAAARHYDSLPFSDITKFSDKYLKES